MTFTEVFEVIAVVPKGERAAREEAKAGDCHRLTSPRSRLPRGDLCAAELLRDAL